jgi:tetratricopeptide (TPR) repeat protein
MMFIGRPIANVVDGNFYQASLAGALQDAGLQIGLENIGEQRKHIKTQVWRHNFFILAVRMGFGKENYVTLTLFPREWYDDIMYLRGSNWSMKKRRRRTSGWRIALLVILIGAALYVNQVVVPATPPLFIPTATPTISPETFINQAQQYSREGKIDLAISAYQDAIKADPTNPSIYIELARLQVWKGHYEEAIRNTQNALLENPNNALAHAVQGWALGFQRKYAEAELELKQALALDPNNALAHAYLAEVYVNQASSDYTMLEKAVNESRIAVQLAPDLFETHRVRGIVLWNTGQENMQAAIDELNKALAINKTIADVHLYLGLAYKSLPIPDFDKAEESFLNAIAYNPQDTTALIEISRAYFSDGRYQQAAQHAEAAVQIEPENARVHGYLGIVYYRLEQFSKAIYELGVAVNGGTWEMSTADGGKISAEVEPIQLDPFDQRTLEYHWFYGFALAKANRCREAVPVFQRLLSEAPNDQLAVDNANAGLEICQENLENPPEETAVETEAVETEAETGGTPEP